MKKTVVFLSVSLLFADMNSFLDNAINSITEEAGYYKSQTRGLYTLGGARIRFNNQGSFSPFHAQPPKISFGCGGIDAIFGGFSYLDTKYLVEKLKAITAAAPAFAFKMALSALCKDCDAIMTELEKIANMINSINFDTCKASKRVASLAMSKANEAINFMLDSGQSNNYIEKAEEAKSSFTDTMSEYINTISYYLGGDTNKAKKVVKTMTIQGSF
jgi:conjugative transfer pilus assembly protein TraH